MTDKAPLSLVSQQPGSFGILKRGSGDTWQAGPAFLWKRQQNERLNRMFPKPLVSTAARLHIGPFANVDAHSRIRYRSVMHLTVLAGWEKEGNWNVFDTSYLFSRISTHIKKKVGGSIFVSRRSHWVCVKCRCASNLGAHGRRDSLDVIGQTKPQLAELVI